MSMSIVHHVREKSQAKGSARTLLLNLAIYANDCCGVAWPSDTTLFHDVNVSRQRIHELKNALEAMGALVIVERPGSTNLYLVAWQGQPLGGTSRDAGQHDLRCPVRHPHLAASGTALEGDGCPTHDGGEESDISDSREDYAPDAGGGASDPPDPQGSEISDLENQGKRSSKHWCVSTYDRSETIPPTGQCPPESGTAQPLLVSRLWVRDSDLSAPGGLRDLPGEIKTGHLTHEVWASALQYPRTFYTDVNGLFCKVII
jgi:hypothetical protein